MQCDIREESMYIDSDENVTEVYQQKKRTYTFFSFSFFFFYEKILTSNLLSPSDLAQSVERKPVIH